MRANLLGQMVIPPACPFGLKVHFKMVAKSGSSDWRRLRHAASSWHIAPGEPFIPPEYNGSFTVNCIKMLWKGVWVVRYSHEI